MLRYSQDLMRLMLRMLSVTSRDRPQTNEIIALVHQIQAKSQNASSPSSSATPTNDDSRLSHIPTSTTKILPNVNTDRSSGELGNTV